MAVEVAHEALFRSWGKLRDWLSANAEGLRLLREVHTDAGKWEAAATDEDKEPYLWRGGRLLRALEMRDSGVLALDVLDKIFIEAAERAQRAAEQIKERARRRRQIVAWSTSAVFAAFSVFAGYQSRRAEVSQVGAFRASSEARFALNQELDGLVDGLQAARALERPLLRLFSPPPGLRSQVKGNLHNIISNITEGNRLEGHRGWVGSVQFSPNGESLATVSRGGLAQLWDVKGNLLRELANFQPKGGDLQLSVSFDASGERLAVAMSGGLIRIWELMTGQVAGVDMGHDVSGIQFNADGQILATTGRDSTTLLRIPGDLFSDAPSPIEVIQRIDGSSNRALSWSSDFKRLAIAGKNGKARLVEMESLAEVELQGHKGPLDGIATSPDDSMLATASMDGTARLWYLRHRPAVVALREHAGPVNSVSFSPDGKLLATAGADGVVWLRRIESLDELIKRACDWGRNYLRHNQNVDEQSRKLCD